MMMTHHALMYDRALIIDKQSSSVRYMFTLLRQQIQNLIGLVCAPGGKRAGQEWSGGREHCSGIVRPAAAGRGASGPLRCFS